MRIFFISNLRGSPLQAGRAATASGTLGSGIILPRITRGEKVSAKKLAGRPGFGSSKLKKAAKLRKSLLILPLERRRV
jgi:hypothetical protein